MINTERETVSPMHKQMYVAGIDDIATGRAISEGWSYFVIPGRIYPRFDEEASHILECTPLKKFHGKEFRRRFSDQYGQFLALIRTILEQNHLGLIASTLLNQQWKKEYRDFCQRLIRGAYGTAIIEDDDLITASVKLADPLFTLQRFASNIGANAEIRVEIDTDATLRKLTDMTFEVRGVDISAQLPIKAFYSAYRKHVFPNSPALSKDGISVLDDEDSYAIQAADIIGNFSTAYVYYKLGKKSETVKKKAELFHAHFGDLIESVNFNENLEIHGDDLVLKENGAFTLLVNR